MKRLIFFASLSLTLVMTVSALADDPIFPRTIGNQSMLYGGISSGKASRDSTYLLGGPNAYDGRFQDASGQPSWQGWTHRDETYSGEVRWNVDTFNVSPGWGTYAMWCGQRGFPDCGAGYGNSWNENLVFTYTVADPSVATSVRLEFLYNVDSEDQWDWFQIEQNQGGAWQRLYRYSGNHVNQRFMQTIVFDEDWYVGPAGNQLQLRLKCVSDDNTSDEDCRLDTNGFVQVDNILVRIEGSTPITFFENHEDGDNDYWVPVFEQNVGDFSHIWTGLADMDPCASNMTPQAGFIDDGIVVPGTGGTLCVTWCYGPGGYIVNNTGGLAGPSYHLQNRIISPVLEWPAGNDGAVLTFTTYRHEEEIEGVSPGIYYQYWIRSAVNPDDLPYKGWQGPGWVFYGGPDYIRNAFNVTDLLEPGRTVVQISLRCVEYGWVFGYEGVDGTPAPYFDNVSFKVYPFNAPAIAARDIDLANSNFPERGDLDLANPANNWIRFDMAANISQPTHLRNDPGDSICVDIRLTRAGSVLDSKPKLCIKMKANPLFDGVRVLPPNFTQVGDMVEGWVYGDSTFFGVSHVLVPNRYNFDLPDSNFFFPGDVIHYYIEAKDNLNGDVGTATLPTDISAVGDFSGVFPYEGNSDFIVRGLPSLIDIAGHQPRILFWNDFGNRGGENEWYYALNNLGYNEQVDYDVYYTVGPTSGVGNGLGGRANVNLIDGYDVLLYTCGDLTVYTLGNNDPLKDPSNDIGILDNWFERGGKKAFMTGDDFPYSLTLVGGAGIDFLATYLGVNVVNRDVRPLIEGQTAPLVRPVAGNTVFTTADEWVAFGGCLGINQFDAIETDSGAERVAQFMNPSGDPAYTYAAATRYTDIGDVIVMPYDFMFIYNPRGFVPSQPGYTARAEVLRDILIEFGKIPQGAAIDVPDGNLVFSVANYPNPFNPATEIKVTMPRAGHVSLKVYNVRGELVRTLVNGVMMAGVQKVKWDGTSDNGHQVASGVYFYETKYDGQTTINKMALVK